MEREKFKNNYDGSNQMECHSEQAGQKCCEFCLVWGFPCVMMSVISVMAAVKAGTVFTESHLLELCVFLISFTLQLMLYCTLFQELPVMLYDLYQHVKVRQQRGHQSEFKNNSQTKCIVTDNMTVAREQTTPGDNATDEDIAVIKDNTVIKDNVTTKEIEALKAGDEEQQNMDIRKQTPSLLYSLPIKKAGICSLHADDGYQAELDAEKAKVTGAIIEYVHYIMSCFVAEEDMAALCHEIKNWAEDPDYLPQSVALKADLSTVELRHFVWNIGERLGRQNGYDGNARARFAKALFLTEFAGVETDTIKNFTVAADRGRIKIDRPDPGSYGFHCRKPCSFTRHTAQTR